MNPKKKLIIYYKGEKCTKTYLADLICFYAIILELKVKDEFTTRPTGHNSSTTSKQPANA